MFPYLPRLLLFSPGFAEDMRDDMWVKAEFPECRHLSPDLGDRGVNFEEGIVSMASPGAYGPWANDIELRKKVLLAARYFVRLGITVVRRTALEDITDKNVAPFHTDPLDELIEQFARPADKRPALVVFFFTRRFTDEHYAGLRAAFAKNDCLSRLGKSAPNTGHGHSS